MSKLRFRSKAEAECVRYLTACGWERIGRNGQNHERVRWPPTGFVLVIPGDGPKHFYSKVRKTATCQEHAR